MERLINQTIKFKQMNLNRMINDFKNEANRLDNQNSDIVLMTLKPQLENLIILQKELDLLKNIKGDKK